MGSRAAAEVRLPGLEAHLCMRAGPDAVTFFLQRPAPMASTQAYSGHSKLATRREQSLSVRSDDHSTPQQQNM